MNVVVSTPPPRRRRRKPHLSPEDATKNPRPRKQKSTEHTKKKSKQNIAILRGALFVAAGLTLVSGIFLMDWDEIAGSFGVRRSPQQLLKQMQYYQNEQIELITSFKNKEQAKAGIPQLKKIAIELAKISFEYYECDITEWDEVVGVSREEAMKIGWEFNDKRMQHDNRLREEINRLKREPGLGFYVSQLVSNAQSVGIRYRAELKLNKAKDSADADGYSPVTAGTKLTIGMQIQGIGTLVEWRDCVVKDVYQDGTVRVDFDNGFHSGLFDKKLDRDRLRIPDVITLTNTSESGTARRIEVPRTETPRNKRPRSDRAF